MTASDTYPQGKVIRSSTPVTVSEPLAIEGIDYIEFFVGNARQACFFFCQAFGFTPVGYRGPETGVREAATYAITQGHITFLFTTPTRQEHPISQHLLRHGDGAKDVAFRVPHCEAFFQEAIKNGAVSIEEPTLWEGEFGTIKRAAIKTYGDVIHSIVERKDFSGLIFPGFVPYSTLFSVPPQGNPVGLKAVDHVVGNVELGAMDKWVAFYERVLGFKEMLHFSDKDISTEYSALMSKVLTDGRKIKLPFNEPAQGRKKSQIEEYLEFHNGPGVQHVAMITDDIVSAVRELRNRGVSFLQVPKTYYEEAERRVGHIKEDFKAISELGILVDRDDDGYLLQLFTKPLQDRPTLFFEIIQRRGSQGFGVGNFKALFEAIERDQALRGNL